MRHRSPAVRSARLTRASGQIQTKRAAPSGETDLPPPSISAQLQAAQRGHSLSRTAVGGSETVAQRSPAGAGGSPSLGLRDQLRGSPGQTSIGQVGVPVIQRSLTDKQPAGEGEFTLNLKTESHPGAKSGMSGTISFRPGEKAPDSTSIRLLQVVRVVVVSTGKDHVWSGGEANRNNVMTTEDKDNGVEGGFFVDHSAAAAAPRTAASDVAVSPFYRDYWPNSSNSQDGSKQGTTIQEASLWDYPGANANVQFSFETVAKDANSDHVYGTVAWGFTITDAAKGTVESEHAVGRNVTLRTTDKAIEKFNEFYANPGASTAPK